jgi:hypothetical protein
MHEYSIAEQAPSRFEGCLRTADRHPQLAGVVLPVVGWWLYDIFYITPFLAMPYLHTVNREIFSD